MKIAGIQSPADYRSLTSAHFECFSYVDTESSLPCIQQPTLIPILSQVRQMHKFPPYFQIIHFNIVPIYIQVFLVVSSLQVFQPEFCVHFSPLPCLLHDPLISSSSIPSS